MDRNPYLTNYHFTLLLSLSARRAWIEIFLRGLPNEHLKQVALRKESVDRNFYVFDLSYEKAVALRKESVDRNVNSRLHSLLV